MAELAQDREAPPRQAYLRLPPDRPRDPQVLWVLERHEEHLRLEVRSAPREQLGGQRGHTEHRGLLL